MAKLTEEERRERKRNSSKAYAERNKEKIRIARNTKEAKEKMRLYRIEYNKNNKEKMRKYEAERNKNNPDRKIQNAKWAKENPEKRKVIAKRYRDKNKEKCNAMTTAWANKNRLRQRATQKAYRLNNLDKYVAYAMNREALKKNAIPKWLINCPLEKKRLNQIYLLSKLFQKADGIPRHVDHMWPLNDGGPHWSGNLQVLTAVENTKKAYKVCPIIKKQIQRNLEEARVL